MISYFMHNVIRQNACWNDSSDYTNISENTRTHTHKQNTYIHTQQAHDKNNKINITHQKYIWTEQQQQQQQEL